MSSERNGIMAGHRECHHHRPIIEKVIATGRAVGRRLTVPEPPDAVSNGQRSFKLAVAHVKVERSFNETASFG